MTNLITKAAELTAAVSAMPEVETAEAWTKVAGKERVYIEVIRTDRDGKRYGGSGGKCYIDLGTGKVMASATGYNKTFYLNSFTKEFHTTNGTTDKIRAIVAAI